MFTSLIKSKNGLSKSKITNRTVESTNLEKKFQKPHNPSSNIINMKSDYLNTTFKNFQKYQPFSRQSSQPKLMDFNLLKINGNNSSAATRNNSKQKFNYSKISPLKSYLKGSFYGSNDDFFRTKSSKPINKAGSIEKHCQQTQRKQINILSEPKVSIDQNVVIPIKMEKRSKSISNILKLRNPSIELKTSKTQEFKIEKFLLKIKFTKN